MTQSYNNITATWTGGPESEIDGAGLTWISNAGIIKLAYRIGERVWTNGDIDLDEARSYQIGNIPVLSLNELGPTVTKSNIQEIGSLHYLDVLGDAVLGNVLTVNSAIQRVGINTNNPFSALDILDNNVNIIIGSQGVNSASIGTYTTSDLNIITDDTPRISIKGTGEIIIGSAASSDANVTINGTLTVDTLVTDTRIDRYSPLEFKASRDTSIYGQGLIWSGSGAQRHFIMMAGPDRLSSTDSIEIAQNQSFYIDGQAVLSGGALGVGVSTSNLTKVGTLQSLAVQGLTTLFGGLDATHSTITAKSLNLVDGLLRVSVNGNQINASEYLSLAVAQDEVLYADNQQIAIGNKSNTSRVVKVFGQLTVGVNNPDPDLSLAVAGNVSFGGKKFISSDEAPTEGTFSKGDICWNNNPIVHNYIGWVCVAEGNPGEWQPFGAIGTQ
jgi:hypothetical protein